MPEWSNGLVLKTRVRVTVPWVRIPPPPQHEKGRMVPAFFRVRMVSEVCYTYFMEKIPGKVFHGSHEEFDGKKALPKRQIRENAEGEVIFDEKSFHATPYKWVALAYTEKRVPIEKDGIKGEYSMAVDLYGEEKKVLIIGVDSLEESLEKLYGLGGYLYHFDDGNFVYKEGLGNLEVVTNDPEHPVEVERIDDPVAEMKELGVEFEFADISLEENSQFRFD